MTIQELLVKDGYWPTVIGPRSIRQEVIRDRLGVTIKLSKGTFYINSPITLIDGMRLVGSGKGETILVRGRND